MHLQPTNNCIVVKLDKLKDESRNGVIVLADTAAQRIRTGTVVSVGPGRRSPKTGQRARLDVEPGERVAFLRWHLEHQQGKALNHFLAEFGEDVGMVKEEDILFSFVGELRVE